MHRLQSFQLETNFQHLIQGCLSATPDTPATPLHSLEEVLGRELASSLARTMAVQVVLKELHALLEETKGSNNPKIRRERLFLESQLNVWQSETPSFSMHAITTLLQFVLGVQQKSVKLWSPLNITATAVVDKIYAETFALSGNNAFRTGALKSWGKYLKMASHQLKANLPGGSANPVVLGRILKKALLLGFTAENMEVIPWYMGNEISTTKWANISSVDVNLGASVLFEESGMVGQDLWEAWAKDGPSGRWNIFRLPIDKICLILNRRRMPEEWIAEDGEVTTAFDAGEWVKGDPSSSYDELIRRRVAHFDDKLTRLAILLMHMWSFVLPRADFGIDSKDSGKLVTPKLLMKLPLRRWNRKSDAALKDVLQWTMVGARMMLLFTIPGALSRSPLSSVAIAHRSAVVTAACEFVTRLS